MNDNRIADILRAFPRHSIWVNNYAIHWDGQWVIAGDSEVRRYDDECLAVAEFLRLTQEKKEQ